MTKTKWLILVIVTLGLNVCEFKHINDKCFKVSNISLIPEAPCCVFVQLGSMEGYVFI